MTEERLKLTNEQQVAFDEIINFYDTFNSIVKPYWIVTGVAGTGKTTLLSNIIEFLTEYDILNESKEDDRKVAVITLTWKASIILHSKGVPQAQSIHSFLYCSEWNELAKEFTYTKKDAKELQSKFKLIIVDEASMASEEIKKDLEALEIPIVYVGDPFQLGPVTNNKNEVSFLSNPDSKLTTILRQALENPIIEMSMNIRENPNFKFTPGTYKKKIHIEKVHNINVKWLIWADQILCGTNKTRIEKNTLTRRIQGKDVTKLPDKGEKLIALNNLKTEKIYNGTILFADDSYHKNDLNDRKHFMDIKLEDNRTFKMKTVFADMVKDNQDLKMMSADKKLLQIAFGSVITCHKAQGGQWDKLMIFNEPIGSDNTEKRRWMYTAITRAINQCIILI